MSLPLQTAPNIKKTRFTRMLIETNRIEPEHFDCWIFCEGMRFNSPHKWWGDLGRRDFPHEGLDFCLYADRSGHIRRLDDQTRIPAMHTGRVVAMFTDYLGQAIIVEHRADHKRLEKWLSVYAHTTPADGIRPGATVRRGDIIATIADTSRSKANILPHLHFSLGLPSPELDYQPFVWNLMRDPAKIVLLDPIGLVDWPHRVLDADDAVCLEKIYSD